MSFRTRHPDVALALAFGVFHLVERLLHPDAQGSVAANVVGGLLMSVPFLWLRRRPLLAVLLLVAGAIVNQLLDATAIEDMFVPVVTLVVVGYVVARHHAGRDRWLPLAAAGLGIGSTDAAFGGGSNAPFIFMVLAAGAVGGALVRNRVALTRELAERTHELEALRDMRERDAVLDERRRIARELHDVVAHTVSIMVVQAGGARRQLERDPARALAALDQVESTGEETLRELGRLFGLLHADEAPGGLQDLPALVERMSAAGLPVVLEVEGEPHELDPGAELAAFRLVQEALTNTLKHAGPGATARVELHWGGEALDLRVADTGWGTAGPRGDGTRSGLVGMRERMAALDADVEAGPGRDGGFEVRARLPLAREEVQLA